jgi:hypothetical protein
LSDNRLQDLKPLDEPARRMQEALQQLSGGEWNLQMEALNTIRSLSLFHNELLKGQPGGVSQLHAIMLQVLALCDSLRSTLAKSALMCVEGMAFVANVTSALPHLAFASQLENPAFITRPLQT